MEQILQENARLKETVTAIIIFFLKQESNVSHA